MFEFEKIVSLPYGYDKLIDILNDKSKKDLNINTVFVNSSITHEMAINANKLIRKNPNIILEIYAGNSWNKAFWVDWQGFPWDCFSDVKKIKLRAFKINPNKIKFNFSTESVAFEGFTFTELPKQPFWENLINTKHLKISNLRFIEYGHEVTFYRNFKGLPKLRSLSLGGITIQSFDFIKKINNLEALEIQNCSFSSHTRSIKYLKKLETLVIINLRSLQDRDVEQIICELEHLKNLLLVKNKQITTYDSILNTKLNNVFLDISVIPDFQKKTFHTISKCEFVEYDKENLQNSQLIIFHKMNDWLKDLNTGFLSH